MKFRPILIAAVLVSLAVPGAALARSAVLAGPTDPVFINEIHYDNTGTDAGEAVEIFGPAGTDLTGWSLARYNGANGQTYASPAANPSGSDVLSGTIPDMCGGFGVVAVSYLQDGLQNGAPDGIALVNAASTVVQFLSYEGSFTATNGPASGQPSTDIAVLENGTGALGQSLQLSGAGTLYGDFTWSGSSAASFGAVNAGQTCGSAPTPEPSPTPSPTPLPTPAAAAALVINEIDYDQPGTDTAEFVEIRNDDSAGVDLGGYTVDMINGNAGGAAQYRSFALPAVTLAPGDYFVVCANNTTVANCDLDVTPDTDLVQNGAPDAVALRFGATLVDSVSYEGDTGAPYTEGSGAGLVDSGTGTRSISRCPDGADTNQNNVDFSEHLSSPGAVNACVDDVPPTVTGTVPANAATDVSVSGDIAIGFSEPVSVSGDWFTISCATSGPHTASVSGGPQNFVLSPDADFAFSEACTVTVLAANVADQDGTPDNMAANSSFSFTTSGQPFGACGDPATAIHTLQGNGASSPLNGTTGVIIEAVVVGDYQGSDQFSGFHVQEQDADVDADPATSEGIFVFNSSVAVNPGDLVRVRGRVFEFSSSGTLLTELSPVTDVAVCSSGHSVTASTVSLPVGSLSDWERYEGMLVDIPQQLTVTENFTLARFGEVALSAGGRLFNPTTLTTPGAAAIAQQDLNNRRRILLDDGNNFQNIDPTIHPIGGLSAADTLRSGYTVAGLTGVLEQRFGVYRIQPVAPVSFDAASNPRPAAPENPGGRLKLAALNVLNFFTTLDTNPGSGNGPNICGPLANQECRGANTPAEFDRQRIKILNEILGLNADVFGLMELENNPTASLQSLVDGLNAATVPGRYAFINTGTIGGDAIKVGLIYRTDKVTPVGAYALLTSAVNPAFIDTLNRPVLAQTFSENLTGERFTIAVNHLKSKGSDCNAIGDPDTGDGQGNCNLTRAAAAAAEASWLAGDPTASGDPDFVLVGDFNAYLKEDPITALISAGYTDLIERFVGVGAYSYVFDGQSGYLDHGLANGTLSAQITGANEWHNNADEPTALDYNTEFKTANQVNTFFAPEAFRVSDHDPLLIGLNLLPQCNGRNATIYVGANGRVVGGALNGKTYQGALTGTSGDDVIVGTTGIDTILAAGGNDTICSRGGSDIVLGGAGNDFIDSGDAGDAVFGEAGNDTLNGGAGNDAILGGGGLDTIDGGAGQDIVDGGLDGDTVLGGADNDSVIGGPGNDSLDGGTGNDLCSGGPGTDTATACETRLLIP